VLYHDMHIHEPAVTSEPVQIIHASAELVVANKPAGLPVRPTTPLAFVCCRANASIALTRALC
jgi:23S rRNA-/tRNA-specific pseudouridylate synthase